jgi:hypothetical protein
VTRPGRVVQAIVWLRSGGEKADLTLGLDGEGPPAVPPGLTWMRLGLACSALGTRMRSTPSSIEASTSSASTWAGQGDRAAEGAGAALDPVEVLVGCVVGRVPLTLDGQQAAPAGCPTYSRPSALH